MVVLMCSQFDVIACKDDLMIHQALIQSIVDRDETLSNAKVHLPCIFMTEMVKDYDFLLPSACIPIFFAFVTIITSSGWKLVTLDERS